MRQLPPPVEATLRGFGLDPTGFAAGVRDLSRRFFTMIGRVHRIDAESRRRGISVARRLYCSAA